MLMLDTLVKYTAVADLCSLPLCGWCEEEEDIVGMYFNTSNISKCINFKRLVVVFFFVFFVYFPATLLPALHI